MKLKLGKSALMSPGIANLGLVFLLHVSAESHIQKTQESGAAFGHRDLIGHQG
jgi:hypothetical protein